jgi:HK97 family phage prohead protease
MDFAVSPFELKALDEAGHIEGLAAGVGDMDSGGDTILPGAFARTLAARGDRPLPMLRQHDQGRSIGVWTELKEVPDGLYAKGRITLATRDGAEAYALARDGALPGISIGYVARNPRFDTKGARTLPEIDLHEASLVSVPMHFYASAASQGGKPRRRRASLGRPSMKARTTTTRARSLRRFSATRPRASRACRKDDENGNQGMGRERRGQAKGAWCR